MEALKKFERLQNTIVKQGLNKSYLLFKNNSVYFVKNGRMYPIQFKEGGCYSCDIVISLRAYIFLNEYKGG